MKRFFSMALLIVIVSGGARGQDEQPKDSHARRPRQGRLAQAQVEVYKTVGDVELNLYIFQPDHHQASDRRPAIVFFFGGGWRGGSPRQFAEHCRHFARRGLVAIAADYRVYSRHKVQVKDCVADAKSAIRWIRSHADELGIDADKIVAAGGSAGGHLAAATATLPGFDETGEDRSVSARPNALMLFNPALDLTAAAFSPQFRESRYQEIARRLGAEPQQLSPSLHVNKDTPATIIFHGKADATVPYSQAERFLQFMEKAGNRCELFGYEGQGHGFFNYGRGGNQAYRSTVKQAEEFLDSLGYLKGP